MANLLTYTHLPLRIYNPVHSSAFPSYRNVAVKVSAVTLPEKKTRRKKKQQKEEERGAGSGAEKGLRLVFMEELMERARSRDVAGVSEVLYDMIAAGLSPGPRSFHGLIVSHALNGDDHGAMHALRRELSEGLRPLHETFVTLARLFGSKGLSTRGLEVLAAMEKLNYDIRQAWLVLVEELVRSNHLEDANKVFLKGAEGGLRGTDEIYDLLIEEDCKAGDHSNALTVAYEMEAAGRMATTAHFNFLLSVQATSGIPEIVFATFENMEYGEAFMKPNTETYNWVIQAYTRAESYDRVQDVAELLGMMVEDHKRVQPNVKTYALLVECFTKYGVIGEAIRHFRALKNFEGGTKILHSEGQHGDPLSLYLRALCKEGRIVELLEAFDAMAKDNQPIPPRAMVLSRKYRSLVSSWIEPLQEEAELGYEIDYIARYVAEGGLTGERKRWVPRRGKTPLDPDAFGFIYNVPMETSFKQRCLEDWKVYHRKVLRVVRNEGPSALGDVSESDFRRVVEWLKKSLKGPDRNALRPKAASKMVVSELREELEAQDLPTDGTRNVLYQRVQKARRINRSRGRPLWVPSIEVEQEEFDSEIDELVSRVELNEGNTEFWKRRFLGEGIKSDNGSTIDVKISETHGEQDNDNADDVSKESEEDDEADDEEDDEDEEEEEEVEVESEESENETVDRRVKNKEAEAEKSLQMIGLQLLQDSDNVPTRSKKSRRKVSLMAMENEDDEDWFPLDLVEAFKELRERKAFDVEDMYTIADVWGWTWDVEIKKIRPRRWSQEWEVELALKVMLKVIELGSSPTIGDCAMILRAAIRAPLPSTFLKILQTAHGLGYTFGSPLYDEIITLCLDLGEHDAAVAIVAELVTSGVSVPDETLDRVISARQIPSEDESPITKD